MSRQHLLYYFLVFLHILCLPSCWYEKKNKQQESGLVVINVLDKELYNDCHIQGSINVELDELEQYVRNIHKETEIVIYCSNYFCSTSEFAAKKLKALGFDNIWIYKGGTAEWYQKRLPTSGPAKGVYLTKHIKDTPSIDEPDIQCIDAMTLADKMGFKVART